MPDSPTPDNWLRCRVGSIEFSLPPELANNRLIQKNNSSLVVFQHGSRSVIVALPTNGSEFSELLNTASELCPEAQKFTLPMLRRACYRSSSGDFHWSMTSKEVRWHAFCLTTRRLIRSAADGHTESFTLQDLDGIIDFGGKRVGVDWQSNDGMCGNMVFGDRGDNVDPAWIRAVCQSLKVSNEIEADH